MPILIRAVQVCLELVLLPPIVFIALVARLLPKRIDVGLGPHPLINNIYHKSALERQGYSAETFVAHVYHITSQFDVRADVLFRWILVRHVRLFLAYLYLYAFSITRYRCLYLYFDGGALGMMALLWRIEPLLYRLAGIKTVLMPYGSDIEVMTWSPTLLYKHTMAQDYPKYRLRKHLVTAKVDLWTRHANHIIAGCDWVFYLYHWDTLMIAHFSIDTETWQPMPDTRPAGSTKLRILHAPNHRNIKGTHYFISAIDELIAEGEPVELVVLERVPNEEIRKAIASVDVVADQLIIGWYAMFAMEAMCMAKPVLCFLHPELAELYELTGLVEPGEIPLINCTPRTVKETIRQLIRNRANLAEIGQRSRQYVERHHSLEVVGKVFAQVNDTIGLPVSNRTAL